VGKPQVSPKICEKLARAKPIVGFSTLSQSLQVNSSHASLVASHMATVIIGGGIIGTATAYYLSEPSPNPSSIHIVESTPRLFASASGYAAGFLAKDWFSSPVASLGELSFELHRQLAQEHNGQNRWGYASSTALSLAIDEGRVVGNGERGEDWLLEGTSRANVSAAAGKGSTLRGDGTPAWVTRRKGVTLEKISSEDGCAQVEPRQLCEFLMNKCRERRVQLHMPARATEVLRGQDEALTGVVVHNDENNQSTIIECERVVFAAGAWTPSAFRQLFPDSDLRIPISSLASVVHDIHLSTRRRTAGVTRYSLRRR
jgi:glycine/D-amino acid oxidase-like deaminating enzyme